jgi:hypothetical protein
MRYTKILTPDSSKPKTLYLTTREIAIIVIQNRRWVMWINFDQLLDLPNVTVVNYQKIDETISLKLALLNETIECPNCHQILDRINQTEYNLVRDL